MEDNKKQEFNEEVLEENINQEETPEEGEVFEDKEFEVDETEDLKGEVAKLKDENSKLSNELETLKDRLLRLNAEYDNYRKRTAREKESGPRASSVERQQLGRWRGR